MEYCKCGGMAGFVIVDGELVCQNCGGLSPKAKLVGEQFVKIGEGRVVCPECGYVLQEAIVKVPQEEIKQIYPPESKRIGRPKKRR